LCAVITIICYIRTCAPNRAEPRHWHSICTSPKVVVAELTKLNEINVLASRAGWAWPQALHAIFEPRGISLLMAESPVEFVNIIERRRIHTAIVDVDCEGGGLVTVRIIRTDFPAMPCILLSGHSDNATLDEALRLGVFSVIDKPVDMEILRQQLNRLFLKKYHSDIFG